MDLHIQSSGALAGALVGLSIAASVLGLWNSRIACFPAGFAQTVVLILQLALIHGYFYTTTTGPPPANPRWAASGDAAAGVHGDLPPLRRLRPSLRLIARAIPVILSWRSSPPVLLGSSLAASRPTAMQDEYSRQPL